MPRPMISPPAAPIALLCLLVLGVASGCRTFDVRTDWDPAHSFESARRFAFVDPPEIEGSNPFADNDLLRKRVRHTLVSVLVERGYIEVDELDAADFLVTYSVLLEERLRVDGNTSSFDYGWGLYRPRWGLGAARSTASVRSVQESTLLIDVLTPGTEELVWRGWGTGIIRTRDRDRGDERLFAGVRAILDRFPPGREGER